MADQGNLHSLRSNHRISQSIDIPHTLILKENFQTSKLCINNVQDERLVPLSIQNNVECNSQFQLQRNICLIPQGKECQFMNLKLASRFRPRLKIEKNEIQRIPQMLRLKKLNMNRSGVKRNLHMKSNSILNLSNSNETSGYAHHTIDAKSIDEFNVTFGIGFNK